MGKSYFIFDKNRCIACQACIVACMNENDFQLFDLWRNVQNSNEYRQPGLSLFYLSMSCNHCEEAVCMNNCPALAYSRSAITGAVIHDADKCIGCRYCIWNCPYEAPKYNLSKAVVEKCDFCESRQIRGYQPACSNACPTNALDFSFGEKEKQEQWAKFDTPLDTKPSIIIKELENNKAPKIDCSLFENLEDYHPLKENKTLISAKTEWPLLIFTFIVALMVSVTSTSFFINPSLRFKLGFLSFGILAAFLSLFHLGNKKKAWRAVLNIRKSWLSREITFFSLFMMTIFVDFFIFPISNFIILAIGVLLLISIDSLYRPVEWNWKIKIHSGQVVFIAFTYALLFYNLYRSGAVLPKIAFTLSLNIVDYKQNIVLFDKDFVFCLFGFVFCLRLMFYGYKKNQKNELYRFQSFVRILSAISAILLLFLNVFWLGILVFSLGEFFDRMDFYEQLQLVRVKDYILN